MHWKGIVLKECMDEGELTDGVEANFWLGFSTPVSSRIFSSPRECWIVANVVPFQLSRLTKFQAVSGCRRGRVAAVGPSGESLCHPGCNQR